MIWENLMDVSKSEDRTSFLFYLMLALSANKYTGIQWMIKKPELWPGQKSHQSLQHPVHGLWLTNSEHIFLDAEYHRPSSNMLGGSHGKENISFVSRGKGVINLMVPVAQILAILGKQWPQIINSLFLNTEISLKAMIK